MPSTSRWALPYPASTDPPAGHSQIQALAEALDDVAKDDSGLLSARPTSTPGSPGKAGRYYYATDQKVLYRDTGTSWVVIGNPNQGLGRIGYATRTSNQGPMGTGTTDLTGLSVAVTALPDRLIKISAVVRVQTAGTAPKSILIREGSTQLAQLDGEVASFAGNPPATISGFTLITPTSGAHTYKLSASYTEESGSMTSYASATQPAHILVEDIGPATLV